MSKIKNIREFEHNSMSKYGFYMHAVLDDFDQSVLGVNLHTHGLPKSFNHLDFQVVVPIYNQTFGKLMHNLVNEIKKGKIYKENNYYNNVIKNFQVTFFKVTENKRDVLRLIFPDEYGNLDKDKIDISLRYQYLKKDNHKVEEKKYENNILQLKQ